MNKQKRTLMHLLFLAFFIACIAGIFLAKNIQEEIQKDAKPFDQTMYCFEILKDGTMIECDSFQLTGEIFTATDGQYEGQRCITLLPFIVDDMRISTQTTPENRDYLFENLEPIPYHKVTTGYISTSDGHSSWVKFFLSHDFQYCMIETMFKPYNRCFVAATTPQFDPQEVFKQFEKDFTPTDPKPKPDPNVFDQTMYCVEIYLDNRISIMPILSQLRLAKLPDFM